MWAAARLTQHRERITTVGLEAQGEIGSRRQGGGAQALPSGVPSCPPKALQQAVDCTHLISPRRLEQM